MIIQRISKGIKEQDWFVVMVEVLIVVVGIFIGLQVDDWNEERKNRELELYYLEQLVTDLEGTLESLTNSNKNIIQVSDNAYEAERILSEGLLNEQTAETFQEYAYHSFFSGSSKVYTVTLNQLASDKGMEIVQSRELQKQLGQYLEEIKARRLWEDQWLNIVRNELVKIHHGIGWRGTDRAITSSFDDMMSNQSLINSYAFVGSTQKQLARNQNRLIVDTETFLEKVKEEFARLKEGSK